MKNALNAFAASGVKIDEIALFREMSRYLSTWYSTLFINETHKHYVVYHSRYAKMDKLKEISDIWVVAFSPRKKLAKMTFLQAKYRRGYYSMTVPFIFSGDYYQYELLSTRPKIKRDITGYQLSLDVLSGAISDAVGSYGTFYKDSMGSLDMMFCVASELRCKRRPKGSSEKTKLFFRGKRSAVLHLSSVPSSGIEVRRTLFIDLFEVGLVNLMIGTPIQTDGGMLGILKKVVLRSHVQAPVIDEFVSFITSLQDIASPDDAHGGDGNPNLLLINVDPKG